MALAAVDGQIDRPAAGLAALDRIDGADRFQPAWSTRAHLLAPIGDRDEASGAFATAIELTTDLATRRYLEQRRATP